MSYSWIIVIFATTIRLQLLYLVDRPVTSTQTSLEEFPLNRKEHMDLNVRWTKKNNQLNNIKEIGNTVTGRNGIDRN